MALHSNGVPEITSNKMSPILNTKQYIHYKLFLDSGINELQNYLHTASVRTRYSCVEIDKLTAGLLIITKELTAYLDLITSALVHEARFHDSKLQHLDKTWPTAAIMELSLACHRYSLNVLHIAMAMERNSMHSQTESSILSEKHSGATMSLIRSTTPATVLSTRSSMASCSTDTK